VPLEVTSNAFALNGRNERLLHELDAFACALKTSSNCYSLPNTILWSKFGLHLIHAPVVLCQRPTINDTLDNPISSCLEE